MLAILNSLNAHTFPIFQPILMILVSKFIINRTLSKNTLIIGLLSPLRVRNENLIFLFLNQNICCGYSKEPSQ